MHSYLYLLPQRSTTEACLVSMSATNRAPKSVEELEKLLENDIKVKVAGTFDLSRIDTRTLVMSLCP